jgi:putative transposase
MPDHLHLLLVGEEYSPLTRFMKLFKQKSSFIFKKSHGDPLWQKSYYDHVLRKEEALEEVALYIYNNPVRKGLVTDYKDYPFLGSLELDME